MAGTPGLTEESRLISESSQASDVPWAQCTAALLLFFFAGLKINQNVVARGSRLLGTGLWRGGDVGVIDGVLVNGTANTIGRIAGVVRRLQTGYLYHYAFAMVIGLVVLVGWLIW